MATTVLAAACARKTPAAPESAVQTIRGLTLTKLEHGAICWTLTAARATLAEADGDVRLRDPRMEILQPARGRAVLQSREGTVRQSTGDVRLSSAVVVTVAEPGRPRTTLTTDALDYLDARKQFHTDHPVFITRGASRMRGRGLTANRDLTEIQVLDEEAVLR